MRAPITLDLHITYFNYPDVPPEGLFDHVAEMAKTAEDSGFSSVSFMDHLHQIPPMGSQELNMLEGNMALAGIAARTQKVSVGLLVGGVTYRNPALLAKMTTTLDVISGGRAIFGIGAAWFEAEHQAYGVRFPPLKERFEHLEDTLRIARAMFTEERATVEGTHHRVDGALNNPRPLRGDIPILIGGSGERKTLRLVAQYGDGCNLFGDVERVEAPARRARPPLRGRRARPGRDHAHADGGRDHRRHARGGREEEGGRGGGRRAARPARVDAGRRPRHDRRGGGRLQGGRHPGPDGDAARHVGPRDDRADGQDAGRGLRLTALAVTLYDVVLWVHVTAVVVAFGALFAYPIFLAVNARAPIAERAGLHRAQIAFSRRVTGPAIGVILLAGIYLATDAKLWDKAWVGISFVLLFVIAGLGATILRRGEERLEATADGGDEAGYAPRSRPCDVDPITLALIVFVIFLMTTKPF